MLNNSECFIKRSISDRFSVQCNKNLVVFLYQQGSAIKVLEMDLLNPLILESLYLI